MKNPLKAQLIQVSRLSVALEQEMFSIFNRYYDYVSEKKFSVDLREKDHVIVLRSEEQVLRGFSTLSVHQLDYKGRPIRIIFSGDTIIEKEFWGDFALPQAWCRLAGQLKGQYPEIPLYWLLIVKGHRTYRFMTLLSREHYPNWRNETPKETADLMRFLGQYKFGKYYDEKLGLIRFGESQGQLKPEYGLVSEKASSRPDTQYFIRLNPGYLAGDELLCFTELSHSNVRSIAKKSFFEGYAEPLSR